MHDHEWSRSHILRLYYTGTNLNLTTSAQWTVIVFCTAKGMWTVIPSYWDYGLIHEKLDLEKQWPSQSLP
jgi:hypothetical protein